ncbi:hypothetical protein DL93DRAFT_577170 [Clavulina sp. PMI_390]|nr:hypothetical protein DL93DRAFT_577170 [Clavulina sp. PMI_390]
MVVPKLTSMSPIQLPTHLIPTALSTRSTVGDPYLAHFLLGTVLNSFWTGVVQVQTYLFFKNFPKDPHFTKILVATMWLLQIFFLGATVDLVYIELIRAPKDFILLSEIPWILPYLGTHKMLINTLTQIFFASRLWGYGREPLIMVFLGILIAANIVMAIVNTVESWRNTTGKVSTWSVTPWNVLIVVTDIVISIYLSYLMRKRRSGFRSTDSMLTSLTLYGVANGAISSAIALLVFVGNQIGVVTININILLWSSPLLICVVLANLHLRNALRARLPVDESIPTPSFSLKGLGGFTRRHSLSQRARGPSGSSAERKTMSHAATTEPGTEEHPRTNSTQISGSDFGDIMLIEAPSAPSGLLAGPSCRKARPEPEGCPPRTPTTQC